MENYETIEEVIKTAEKAGGSALEENERYLESIQGRIDLFTNSLQEFWYNLLDSEVVKEAVDAGTKLVNVLGNVLSGITESKTLNLLTDLLSGIVNLLDQITTISGKASTALAGVLGVGLYKKIKGKDGGGRAKVYQMINISKHTKSVLIKYATEQVSREVSEL